MANNKFKITSDKEAKDAFARLINTSVSKFDRAVAYNSLLAYFGDNGNYRILLSSYTGANDDEEGYLRRLYANISDEALSMVVQARIMYEGMTIGMQDAPDRLIDVIDQFVIGRFRLFYGVLATSQESRSLQERYPSINRFASNDNKEPFCQMLDLIMIARVKYTLLINNGDIKAAESIRRVIKKISTDYPDLDYGVLATAKEVEGKSVDDIARIGNDIKSRIEATVNTQAEHLPGPDDQIPPPAPRGRG